MDEFTGRRFELAASTDGLTVIVEPLEIIQIVLHSDKRMTFTWQRISGILIKIRILMSMFPDIFKPKNK